jgi:hypothetical protein
VDEWTGVKDTKNGGVIAIPTAQFSVFLAAIKLG